MRENRPNETTPAIDRLSAPGARPGGPSCGKSGGISCSCTGRFPRRRSAHSSRRNSSWTCSRELRIVGLGAIHDDGCSTSRASAGLGAVELPRDQLADVRPAGRPRPRASGSSISKPPTRSRSALHALCFICPTTARGCSLNESGEGFQTARRQRPSSTPACGSGLAHCQPHTRSAQLPAASISARRAGHARTLSHRTISPLRCRKQPAFPGTGLPHTLSNPVSHTSLFRRNPPGYLESRSSRIPRLNSFLQRRGRRGLPAPSRRAQSFLISLDYRL